MSSNIEIRLLQAAIALAEELNYSRAADRLHISQSALTKQIHELESILPLALFERDKKHVALLHPGEVFVEEARLALMHGERAVYLAKAAASEESRTVVIGRSPYADPYLIDSLFSVNLPMFPKLHVKLESAFAQGLLQSVSNGSMDMAIATAVPETKGITEVLLRTTRLHVALPETHPAAHNEFVYLRDLSGICWALFAKQVNPWLYDSVLKIVADEGISIVEIQHFMTAKEAISLVSGHDCVALLTDVSAGDLRHEGVVFRPLNDDPLLLRTVLLMRADNASRLVNNFGRTYIRQFKRKGPQSEFSWDSDAQKAS
jgi:DNA-binding transcriptional LysR family regulator